MKAWSIALIATMLVACGAMPSSDRPGTDPFTEPTDSPPAASGQPVEIGARHFLAARQMMGGDLVVDADLATYVQGVGRRIAAVSGHHLPFEFAIVNNSVPNIWSLPGGRIGISRGLLMQLECEAQLAALIAHEVTHSAAGGMLASEGGTEFNEHEVLLSESALALRAGVSDSPYAPLVIGHAALAANLITRKHDLQEELDADRRALLYLRHAGYDPGVAVDMLRAFVRVARNRGGEERELWERGLFISHPPSQERVTASEELLARWEEGEEATADGELRCDAYQRATEKLHQLGPAYAAYDEGIRALRGGNLTQAEARAREALMIARGDIPATASGAFIVLPSDPEDVEKDEREPEDVRLVREKALASESKFHGLLGKVARERGDLESALVAYHDAVQLNPGYFEHYLALGLIAHRLEENREAARLIDVSMSLLPTATGAYHLGRIAQKSGDLDLAIHYYRLAATSDSAIGRTAARELIAIDLPRNPARYVSVEPDVDRRGRVWMVVQNRAPVAIGDVVIAAKLAGREGEVVQGPFQVATGAEPLEPGEAARVPTPLGPLTGPTAIRLVDVQIEAARVARQ